jgi:aryl-alcohol dehydrogenase-like predicted oxidoreductase
MTTLVFGAVQLGMQYGIANSAGKPELELSKKMLETAINNGVEVIDTASAYGDSEWVIGQCLDQRLKSRVSIVTKLDPLSALTSQAGTSECEALVDASVYSSLTKLAVSRIDTLLLHRYGHLIQNDGAIFNRLLGHLREGRIGSLGVSVQKPEEAIQAISYQDIEHIQMPFNIFDWRWTVAIERIKEVKASRRLVVNLRSIFLQGLLLIRKPESWQRANCTNPEVIFQWMDIALARFGRDSVQDLCIAFVNSQDWADGIVIGMETYDQLLENLTLVSKDPLTASQRDELMITRPYLQEATLNPSLWGAH